MRTKRGWTANASAVGTAGGDKTGNPATRREDCLRDTKRISGCKVLVAGKVPENTTGGSVFLAYPHAGLILKVVKGVVNHKFRQIVRFGTPVPRLGLATGRVAAVGRENGSGASVVGGTTM